MNNNDLGKAIFKAPRLESQLAEYSPGKEMTILTDSVPIYGLASPFICSCWEQAGTHVCKTVPSGDFA